MQDYGRDSVTWKKWCKFVKGRLMRVKENCTVSTCTNLKK